MAEHFYDGQIRKYLVQLMRLFSNFSYATGDGTKTQVPVLYGDLTRQVSSILRDNSENKIPSAPRMAIYITGLEMDRDRTSDASYVNKRHVRERAPDGSGGFTDQPGKQLLDKCDLHCDYTEILKESLPIYRKQLTIKEFIEIPPVHARTRTRKPTRAQLILATNIAHF